FASPAAASNSEAATELNLGRWTLLLPYRHACLPHHSVPSRRRAGPFPGGSPEPRGVEKSLRGEMQGLPLLRNRGANARFEIRALLFRAGRYGGHGPRDPAAL